MVCAVVIAVVIYYNTVDSRVCCMPCWWYWFNSSELIQSNKAQIAHLNLTRQMAIDIYNYIGNIEYNLHISIWKMYRWIYWIQTILTKSFLFIELSSVPPHTFSNFNMYGAFPALLFSNFRPFFLLCDLIIDILMSTLPSIYLLLIISLTKEFCFQFLLVVLGIQ